jgi:hypothetical protein
MTSPKTAPARVKLVIDIVSIISFSYLVFVCPILGHYESQLYKPDGTLSLPMTLMFADGPLALFSVLWLSFRYADSLKRKYPFLFDPRPQSKLLVVLALLLLYFVGYLILKYTLWR